MLSCKDAANSGESVNGSQIMQCNQPSFVETDAGPIIGSSMPSAGSGPVHDLSYYPSTFYRRN